MPMETRWFISSFRFPRIQTNLATSLVMAEIILVAVTTLAAVIPAITPVTAATLMEKNEASVVCVTRG